MDLSNKTVIITMLSSTTFPPSTNVEVRVSEEVIPGVHKVVGVYSLNFQELYSGLEEPALLAAVYEQLTSLPE